MNFAAHNLYAGTARFDHAIALDNDAMRKLAPSIFATEAHSSRSERFKPIPTIEIVEGLRKEGFSPVAARQCVARLDDRKNYTKHMIRFRRLDDGKTYNVGDTVHEIILKNANDGTAAYDLLSGLFRIRCMNSLVSQSSELDSLKVRHSGDVQAKVIEGTYTVLANSERALAAPQDWGAIQIGRDHAMALAEAAHTIRFADAEGKVATPIKPAQLLIPRRADDREPNLWTAWNVVQENCVKGGLAGYGRSEATGRVRRTTTRGVNGIDQDIKLNRALWTLGERMAAIMGGAPATA